MPDNLPTIPEEDNEGIAEREYLDVEQAEGISSKSEGIIYNMQRSFDWQLDNIDMEWKSELCESGNGIYT